MVPVVTLCISSSCCQKRAARVRELSVQSSHDNLTFLRQYVKQQEAVEIQGKCMKSMRPVSGSVLGYILGIYQVYISGGIREQTDVFCQYWGKHDSKTNTVKGIPKHSPSGQTHKVAGLGVAWLGDVRIERQWQMGSTAQLWEGLTGRDQPGQPFHRCTFKTKVVGKGVQCCLCVPKGHLKRGKERTSWQFFLQIYFLPKQKFLMCCS